MTGFEGPWTDYKFSCECGNSINRGAYIYQIPTLFFNQVFEEALKTWSEKQKLERPVSPRQNLLTDEESAILQSFVEATEALIKRWVKTCNFYQ